MCPSSIFTGKCTVSSRRGFFRTSSIPPSRFKRLPARSICSRATSKGLYSFAFAMRTAPISEGYRRWREYRRPLLNIVLEVRAGDSQPPPAHASAASVPRSHDPVLGRIDDVPRFLPAEEAHDVLQRGLHRARPLSWDRGGDMRRHHQIRKVLERPVERPALLGIRVRPPRVQGRAELRMGFQMVEQVVLHDELPAGDVHEDRVVFHLDEEPAVHEALRGPGQGERENDDVRLGQISWEVVQRADLIGEAARAPRPRDPDDAHVERLAARRDFGPLAPEAEGHARGDGWAYVRDVLVENPAADLIRATRDVFRGGEEEGHRVLRD